MKNGTKRKRKTIIRILPILPDSGMEHFTLMASVRNAGSRPAGGWLGHAHSSAGFIIGYIRAGDITDNFPLLTFPGGRIIVSLL